MKEEIKKFKDQLIKTMTTAFEIDGQFVPTVFFLKRDGQLLILVAPGDIMATNQSKDSLANLIKEKCKDPLMKAAAIIMEINIKNPDGTKIGDGLLMVVSTKEGDDVTIYNVDCDRKKVIGLYNTDLPGAKFRGRFSGFFQNNNN
jgi:hypothetical protein